MLIDTHAHLNFADYEKDREEVIKRCRDNDVWVVNVGTNYESSKKAVKLAEKYEKGVYAAVGLHPINISPKSKVQSPKLKNENRFEDFLGYEKYKELAKSKKVVAIGETGLDFWEKPKTRTRLEEFKKKQVEVFLEQLGLARELNLPVILHCRKAHNDLLSYLTNIATARKLKCRGVIHCFTGTWEQAEKYLAMGFYLGFNGIIFKLDLDEIIKKVPLNRILIETDCPFLCPSEALAREGWYYERNEPIYVKYVVQRIAELKKEPFEKIAEVTTQNARKLFSV